MRTSGFSTRAIKASTRAPRVDQQPNSVPIYQAVSFSADDAEELGDDHVRQAAGYSYSRITNPTGSALEAAVAEIHGADDAEAFASGMAAIHATLATVLSAGDRIVCTRAVYGSTRSQLLNVLSRLGVNVTFVDALDHAAVEAALAAQPTRVLYVETIANPTDRHHRYRSARDDRPSPRRPAHRRQHVRVGVSLPAARARGGPGRRIGHEVHGGHSRRPWRRSSPARASSSPGCAPSRSTRAPPSPRSRPSSSCAAWPRSRSAWTGTRRPPPRWRAGSRVSRASCGCTTRACRSHPQAEVAAPPVAGRRRDARVRGRRRARAARPGVHRRPDDPGADGLARQHPHDRRPPAVDHAPPARRRGARRVRHRAGPAALLRRARGRSTTCGRLRAALDAARAAVGARRGRSGRRRPSPASGPGDPRGSP